jgi:hypothetical protein
MSVNLAMSDQLSRVHALGLADVGARNVIDFPRRRLV